MPITTLAQEPEPDPRGHRRVGPRVARHGSARPADPRCPGRAGVRSFGWKGPPGARTPHAATIEEAFRPRPPHTAHEAARRLEELTGVRGKVSWVRALLKDDRGMKCSKVAPIPVPPKETVEEHARAPADPLKAELEPRPAQARGGKRVVYFVDASHVVPASLRGEGPGLAHYEPVTL